MRVIKYHTKSRSAEPPPKKFCYGLFQKKQLAEPSHPHTRVVGSKSTQLSQHHSPSRLRVEDALPPTSAYFLLTAVGVPDSLWRHEVQFRREPPSCTRAHEIVRSAPVFARCRWSPTKASAGPENARMPPSVDGLGVSPRWGQPGATRVTVAGRAVVGAPPTTVCLGARHDGATAEEDTMPDLGSRRRRVS